MKTGFIFSLLFFSFISQPYAQEINYEDIYQGVITAPEQTFYELEQLLSTPELDINDKNKLLVLQSEIAYFIDQPEHVLTYVSDALSSGLLNNRWHTKALISKARGHYQRRENKLYLITAQRAVNKAKNIGAPIQETAATVELALAYVISNKFDLATEKVTLAKKYLSLLENGFNKSIILQRYSIALQKLGRYQQSVDYSIEAIKVLETLNCPHYISIGYYNLARMHETEDKIALAEKNMKLSYRWAIKDNSDLNQAFSLSRLAQYQEQLTLLDEAKKTLNTSVEVANKTNSNRVKIQTLKSRALFSCKYDEDRICQAHLEKAISHAQQYDLKKDSSELLQVLADELYKNKQFKEAYETLKEGFDLINTNPE